MNPTRGDELYELEKDRAQDRRDWEAQRASSSATCSCGRPRIYCATSDGAAEHRDRSAFTHGDPLP